MANLIVFLILFNLTKDMSPVKAFPIAGISILLLGIVAFTLVKERKMPNK
jgi:hypothetical protein